MIVGLFIAPQRGAAMQSVEHIDVEADRGILGDRYHSGNGTWSHWPDAAAELTFIAEESLHAIAADLGRPLPPGIHRRTIVTRGVDLLSLIGKGFRIGTVHLLGDRPCAPCGYLESLTFPGMKEALLRHGQGGLRAKIRGSGRIALGDGVER